MDTNQKPNAAPQRNRANNPEGAKRKKRKKGLSTGAKISLVAGLLAGSWIIGLIIGYAVIGNEPVGEVFSFKVWKHLFYLIFG